MNWTYLCILIAGLLPLAGTAAAKWGFKGYDNHNPREWVARQTGFRARGRAAEANSLEAFPFFAAGALAALHAGAPLGAVHALSVAFVALRVAYIALYIADRASLRSLAWAGGVACTIALFVLALRAG